MSSTAPQRLRRPLALALVILLAALPARAGIIIRATQGITMTGVDGIHYDGTSGITMTGVDGLVTLPVNGIFKTSSDGITMTGVDGITMTGVDGVSYTGANSYAAGQTDGITMTGADGMTLTGVNGITMTGVDGRTWMVNSVVVREPNGITMTGVDGITMTGVDGLPQTAGNGITMTGVDGITMTGVDSARLSGAGVVAATKTDGTFFNAPTNGITMTGVDGITMTGVDGITMTGVDGFRVVETDGLPVSELDGQTGVNVGGTGLLSFDPELALLLDQYTDDSTVNAVIIYHRPVTDSDIAELEAAGVSGGTRFRALPMVTVTATKEQIDRIGDWPSVMNIYGNRTLEWNADASRARTGHSRARSDADLLRFHGGLPLEGSGVAVAVLDTGLDASHPDLAGRVVRNVKLADLQGANLVGFRPPENIEALGSTDTAGGHGTFVGGVIAGTGARSSYKYQGYAPQARLVGLSAGDASLFNVLAGFDYLLSHPELGVRVVNCSFSANTVYDELDPVNVATRMLFQRGVNVVFSAGNSGPGMHTLNPYAAVPWVISVGATDPQGRLADFSSRGDFGSRRYRPTLVAPGTGIVSLRSSGVNLTGTPALGADAARLTPDELPYYTTASGTSFSAPQVAGTIALMLEADPGLTPARVRDILQRTATPMPPYYQHEVGAGMLNAHAAVLEAAFPSRQIGHFRAVMARGQVRFVKEPDQTFKATVMPGGQHEVSLRVPANAVFASTQLAWGPIFTPNDLSLRTLDPQGQVRGESNYLNLPGLTGKRERTLVGMPQAGTWRARVAYTLGAGVGPQEFAGVFETARVEFAPINDISTLDAARQRYVREAVRTLTMWPEAGGYFRPARQVTRAELAAAVVAAGRAPQYVPDTPSFTDVFDTPTMNAAESARELFPDAPRGGPFRPDARVNRLLAAVVLVRAAGLEDEAQANMTTPTTFTDSLSIPFDKRGYAYVAYMRGLLPSGEAFNPNGDFTRVQLAQALATITQLALQQ